MGDLEVTEVVPPATGVHEVESAWGRTLVRSSDLALLAEHTGKSPDQCLTRLQRYNPAEIAEAWRARAADEPVIDFYAGTDLYLWELLTWHGSEAYRPYLRRLERLRAVFPVATHPRVLDYGAGIGTAALVLASHGYDVTLADVPGRTLDFARDRLRRAGASFDVIEIRRDVMPLPREAWDLVVSYDVLEHVVDPTSAARALVDALRVEGGAAITASFADDGVHPQHLAGGIQRYSGHRWNLWLQTLGMRYLGDDLFRKVGGAERALLRARFRLWRLTGLYVTRPGR